MENQNNPNNQNPNFTQTAGPIPQGPTKFCQHCQSVIAFNAKVCPICKKRQKGKSSLGCLTVILVVFLIFIGISIGMAVKTGKGKNQESAESITVIEDAEQFSRISTSELKNIMGEPISENSWTNKTSKGDFAVTTLSYDKNSNHYEFIIAEDSVVRLTIYSNNYWTKTGDRFPITSDKKDICQSFNISLGENAKKVVDNNFTYILSPVNEKVAMFNVQDIDSDTYGLVIITYNLNYFD